MRVLVTGGAGFIGAHTVEALVRGGAQVAVVDNLLTGRRERVPSGVTFHEANIADARFSEIVRDVRPEVIYHFAFYVLVPRSVETPLLDIDALAGSVRLLQEARTLGVRKVVFASSGFLYGNASTPPVTEAAPVDPVTPYALAKHAVEGYLRFFNRTYRLPHVVLRYAAVYGPGQVTGAMSDYMGRTSRRANIGSGSDCGSPDRRSVVSFGPLDPIVPRDKKGFSSRAIVDACRPYEWLKDFPHVSGASSDLKKTVLDKFGKYLS